MVGGMHRATVGCRQVIILWLAPPAPPSPGPLALEDEAFFEFGPEEVRERDLRQFQELLSHLEVGGQGCSEGRGKGHV